ncbi:hypothetical protein [uncultured Croceitalea sp.]
MNFLRPGKPKENPYIKSFNKYFEDECPKCKTVLFFGRCSRKT